MSRFTLRATTIASLALAGLLAVTGIAGAQEVFPGSSGRALRGGDLRGLSCMDLWVARNEIFDRNGYCFRTRMGRQYFDNSDCWTNNADLSRLEWNNVNLIKSFERRNNCRINN